MGAISIIHRAEQIHGPKASLQGKMPPTMEAMLQLHQWFVFLIILLYLILFIILFSFHAGTHLLSSI